MQQNKLPASLDYKFFSFDHLVLSTIIKFVKENLIDLHISIDGAKVPAWLYKIETMYLVRKIWGDPT